MGDRRNIQLLYGERHSSVYLYTHWQGTDLPTILADALNSEEGRKRWNDPTYLARIIFTHMIGTEPDNKETGFGIAPCRMDYNHPDIVVNLIDETVDGTPYEEYIETWATHPVKA